MQERPDPDALLREIQDEEHKKRPGKLKIFLGAAAGVGKTYAMLAQAHEQKDRGIDVVIGYVESHGRQETLIKIEGLDKIPMRLVEYKGVTVPEFDLDAALERNPRLILVDELAHSNAPGSRHKKRWQDIAELLHAGIDVFTAVNIQHLETLNDAVAQITGVAVRETVPDAFVQAADNIEVIDIPPEELMARLREGKVYIPERIEHALQGFFREGNLIALRELALRHAADRVDAQMQTYREQKGVSGTWPARERVVVCIAPNKLGTRVVRSAARIGSASHAQMIALFVESDRQARRTPEEHERARQALRLAESLGMETVTLTGHDIVAEVIGLAVRKNATLIVVGKPVKPRWREILFGSVVDELVRRSGNIDVHVITGEAGGEIARPPVLSPHRKPEDFRNYGLTVGIVAIATGICFLLDRRFEFSNLVMVYLLAIAFVASQFGRAHSILASVLSVAVLDFVFVPPRWTFAVSDARFLITFLVMVVVGLLISSLTQRLRQQLEDSSSRERRTAALYTLSRELAASRGKREIAEAAAKEIRNVFDFDVAVLAADDMTHPLGASKSGFELDPSEVGVATWALNHSETAGKGTDTLPASRGMYLPLRGTAGAVGVLAVLPGKEHWPLEPAQQNLLETFSNGLGLALERAILAKESHEARIQAESERLRNALLSSISHDLRTPLTAITGAATSLVAGTGDAATLAETIVHESVRLNLQVQNLLDMTRLQSGEVEPRLEWNSLEELVGTALSRTKDLLKNRDVCIDIPESIPLVNVDGDLIEKVITNVLENVDAHTPPGTGLEITAKVQREVIALDVADRGPGIPEGQESAIFERFSRGGSSKAGGGFGLGLSICRAIMRLHKGRIWAENRADGPGAVFHVELPRSAQPEVPRG